MSGVELRLDEGVPTDVVSGSVCGSATIPIAFLIPGMDTTAPGGTCLAKLVKLSVIFSAIKKIYKYCTLNEST